MSCKSIIIKNDHREEVSMRSIHRNILFELILMMAIMPLFSQLPDPYDLEYKPSMDILRPEEAVKHHVRSCEVYLNDEYSKTIIYHTDGHVLMNHNDYYFTLHDEKGWKIEKYNFNNKNYMGRYSYKHTPYGDPLEIFQEQATTLGNYTIKMIYKYENGLLAGVDTETHDNMTYYIYNNTKNEKYIYDKYRQLEKIESKSYSSSYGLFNSETESSQTNYFFDDGKLIKKTNDSTEYRYYYDDKGRLSHVNEVNLDASSRFLETAIEQYTYYDNGLIRSKHVGQNVLWFYKYDYMDPATFMVEIPDQYQDISFWNDAQNYDRQNHSIKNGHVVAKIFVPGLGLYITQLTDKLTIPLIVQPGAKIYLSATNDGIFYAKEDTMNTFALNLERAKNEAYRLYGNDNGPIAMANHIVSEMNKHVGHPAFLYYTDYWDLNNHKQLFLDYTERMLNKYPYNYRVHEVYILLRKSN